MDDKIAKGRQSTGESQPAAKLTVSKVREIKRLLAGGVEQKVIAAVYGVARSRISRIKAGKRWAHVTADTSIANCPK